MARQTLYYARTGSCPGEVEEDRGSARSLDEVGALTVLGAMVEQRRRSAPHDRAIPESTRPGDASSRPPSSSSPLPVSPSLVGDEGQETDSGIKVVGSRAGRASLNEKTCEPPEMPYEGFMKIR